MNELHLVHLGEAYLALQRLGVEEVVLGQGRMGAVAVPPLAIVLMVAFADDIRSVFWVAVIPAMLAVLLLMVSVEEPPHPHAASRVHVPLRLVDLSRLQSACWWVVLTGAVLTLACFSEAFLVLRTQDVGLRIAFVPLVLAVMSVFYALSSYPAGVLADRTNRRTLLAVSFVALVLADVALARAGGMGMVMVGAALWGLPHGPDPGAARHACGRRLAA